VTEELKYKVSLEDAVSEPARKASASLHGLSNSLEGASKGGAHGAGKGWFHELYESEVIRRSITGITAGLHEMGEGFRSLDAEKVLAGATESAAGFAESLSLIDPILGAVAYGAVKLAGSIASLTLDMVDFALEVTNTNQRLEATFAALGGGPKAGKEMLGMFNELATRLPQSREQLADWAKEFQGMGITNLDQVRAHIVATASAAAIMGESGAAAYVKLEEKARLAAETGSGLKLGEKPLERLYKAGVDVTDIANRMGVSTKQLKYQLEAGTVSAARFGEALEATLIEKGHGPLEVMMSSLGALKTKGLETFAHLFDGIDTKPLTDAIKSVIDLGDQGEPSGQVLKDGITTGINGIIHDMAHAITRAEIFFLKLELGAMKSGFTLNKVVTNLKDIGEAAYIASIPIVKIFDAMKWIFDHSVDEVGNSIFKVEDWMANRQAQEDAANRPAPGAKPLAPHASGGIVDSVRNGIASVSAAPGEGLVSIGRGERIMPASAPLSPTMYDGVAPAMAVMSPANSNSGGVHVDHLEVTIQAPQGVTDAKEMTVTGLTIALERLQLASAR
jgi:hypothetical protein